MAGDIAHLVALRIAGTFVFIAAWVILYLVLHNLALALNMVNRLPVIRTCNRIGGAVLGALDGDIPVLATVKDTDFGAEFLDRVRQHPGAELIMLTPENRGEVKIRAEEILSALNIIE